MGSAVDLASQDGVNIMYGGDIVYGFVALFVIGCLLGGGCMCTCSYVNDRFDVNVKVIDHNDDP